MRKYTTLLSLFIALILFSQSNVCSATDYYLIPEASVTAATISSTDAIIFTAVPGRSYCLEMRTIGNAPLAAIQAISATDANLTLNERSRGDASPAVYSPSVINFSALARKCFYATGNPSNISSHRVRATITFTSGSSTGQTEARLFDTTLIGSFNTSVTDFNFMELTNTLSTTNRDDGVISGTITAKNVITDVVIFTRAFTVNPGDRVDVNIHEAAGPGAFGIIVVGHNGPAGSLKGYVSQYNLVSTVPFDFEPVVNQQMLRPSGLP